MRISGNTTLDLRSVLCLEGCGAIIGHYCGKRKRESYDDEATGRHIFEFQIVGFAGRAEATPP